MVKLKPEPHIFFCLTLVRDGEAEQEEVVVLLIIPKLFLHEEQVVKIFK